MSGYRLRNSVPVVIIENQKNVKVAVCNLDITEMEKQSTREKVFCEKGASDLRLY